MDGAVEFHGIEKGAELLPGRVVEPCPCLEYVRCVCSLGAVGYVPAPVEASEPPAVPEALRVELCVWCGARLLVWGGLVEPVPTPGSLLVCETLGVTGDAYVNELVDIALRVVLVAVVLTDV